MIIIDKNDAYLVEELYNQTELSYLCSNQKLNTDDVLPLLREHYEVTEIETIKLEPRRIRTGDDFDQIFEGIVRLERD